MIIKKRNGQPQAYHRDKIKQAVALAFASVNEFVDEAALENILREVEAKFPTERSEYFSLSVEEIQDMVELTLMEENLYKVLKSYILYRQQRTGMRHARQALLSHFPDSARLEDVLRQIQKEYPAEDYPIGQLTHKFMFKIFINRVKFIPLKNTLAIHIFYRFSNKIKNRFYIKKFRFPKIQFNRIK